MWTYPAAGTSLLGPRTKRRFFVLYATRFAGGLACYTQEEIGETTAIAKTQVSEQLEVCSDLAALPKQNKLLATYTDAEWQKQ